MKKSILFLIVLANIVLSKVNIVNDASFNGLSNVTAVISAPIAVTSRTIDRSVTLEFVDQGQLVVGDGITFFISGSIISPLKHIFNCTGRGKIAFIVDPTPGDSWGLLYNNGIKELYPQWWGAFGNLHNSWGFTDEYLQLQKAIDCAAESRLPLYLGNNIYYTSSTLDATNAEIYGVGNSGMSPEHRDSYLLGTLTGDWSGKNGYYSQFLHGHVTGSIITSDSASIIISGSNMNLHDFAVIGYPQKANQIGVKILDNSSTYLDNFGAQGMGFVGIYMPNGAQMLNFENLNCSFNHGYGLFIDYQPDLDCPQEYLSFNKCYFTYNTNYGLYLNRFKKKLTIRNCNFSGCGFYTPSQIEASIFSGIFIQSSHPSDAVGNPHSSCIIIEGNYGEDLYALAKISSTYVLQDIMFSQNVMYLPGGNTNNGHNFIVGLFGNYMNSVELKHNSAYGTNLYFSAVNTLSNLNVIQTGYDYNVNAANISSIKCNAKNVAIGTYSSAPTDGLAVSGRVGIGTATPSAKLDVAGDVKASKFILGGVQILSGSATPTKDNDGGAPVGSLYLKTNGTVGTMYFKATSTSWVLK